MAFWYVVAFKAAAAAPAWLKHLIAKIIALGYFCFNTEQRRGVFANLRIIRPQASHCTCFHLAAQTFVQSGLNLVDFFSIPSMSDEQVRFMAVNSATLRSTIQEKTAGKPFCIVTGHYGNWELAGAILGECGFRTHAVALTHANPIIERLYETLRDRFGLVAHDVRYGLRQLLRGLPKGDAVAIVADRDYGSGGQKIAFFGHSVRFPKGAAVLCRRLGLVGIPGFLVRQRDGRYFLLLGDAVQAEGADEASWVTSFIQDYAYQYEAVINKDPTQFLNFYDFWSGIT